MKFERFPEFRPHRLLRGGHRQTLAGAFLPWRKLAYSAAQHFVELPDGDSLVLHDDCPAEWKPGQRVVLLMHGLSGCHLSQYMIRASHRLCEQGLRTFRLDLRGCGAGAGLAKLPYHAGRSDDVSHVIQFLLKLCPQSPVCLVGYSLSGNVVLKFLGEFPERVSPFVERAMVINPPIDLKGCVRELDRFSNRLYGRHFVRLLHRSLKELRQRIPDVLIPESYRQPRGLYDFDDQYTAPAAGFENADDYYARCSAAQFVSGIEVPTLILTARDDPLVPVSVFENLNFPKSVVVHISEQGGHLGYIAKAGDDPDRRWMDWRIVDWMKATADEIPQSDRITK